eukprot:352356_1
MSASNSCKRCCVCSSWILTVTTLVAFYITYFLCRVYLKHMDSISNSGMLSLKIIDTVLPFIHSISLKLQTAYNLTSIMGSSQCVFHGYGTKNNCSTLKINTFNDVLLINKTESFTIIINTWKRNKCLMKCIKHWLSCNTNKIAQIRIVWSDSKQNIIPNELLQLKQHSQGNKIIFDQFIENKLTNRFKYHHDFMTDAIFSIDDDKYYSCDDLLNAFKIWQLFPDRMVGFAPRQAIELVYYRYPMQTTSLKRNILHLMKNFGVPLDPYFNAFTRFYRAPTAYRYCSYSMMFVTLGGFLHKRYYQLYDESSVLSTIKQYVDGNMTAEDISMSLLYSYSSGKTPIAIAVQTFHSLKCGISKTMHTNSVAKRRNIAADTFQLFNDTTLQRLSVSTLFIDASNNDKHHSNYCYMP